MSLAGLSGDSGLSGIIQTGASPPPPPSYTATPSVSSVNEGGTVTFTITTTLVPDSTVLFWTNNGTTVLGDFSSGTMSGSVTIISDAATTTPSFTLSNDVTTEGAETIVFNLRTGSTSGPIVGTATVTVNDTSAGPTYTVTRSAGTINEGQTVTLTITTTNVADNTVLFWTNNGSTSLADFSSGAMSGSVTIISNAATTVPSFTLNNDLTTEGVETIVFNLRTGSTSGPIVNTTTVTVFDTSL